MMKDLRGFKNFLNYKNSLDLSRNFERASKLKWRPCHWFAVDIQQASPVSAWDRKPDLLVIAI